MQHTGVGALQFIVPQTTVGGVELVVEVVVIEVVMTEVVVTLLLTVIALEVETEVAPVVETAVVETPALVVTAELCVATVVVADDDDAATPPSSRVERSVEFDPLHAASHTIPSDTSKRPIVFILSPFSNDDGTGGPSNSIRAHENVRRARDGGHSPRR
jgi:hypothetical protein